MFNGATIGVGNCTPGSRAHVIDMGGEIAVTYNAMVVANDSSGMKSALHIHLRRSIATFHSASGSIIGADAACLDFGVEGALECCSTILDDGSMVVVGTDTSKIEISNTGGRGDTDGCRAVDSGNAAIAYGAIVFSAEGREVSPSGTKATASGLL